MKRSTQARLPARRGTIYCGRILNPVSATKMEWLEKGFMVVDNNGKIVSVSSKLEKSKLKDFEMVDLKNQVIMPGLIDAHAHIPQYAFTGLGHLPLLEWLKTYTFPHEERFSKKLSQAREESQNFFSECLRLGTTTVVAYATSGVAATEESFKAADASGIRGFLGLVLMDENSPKAHILKLKDAVKAQEALIKKWHGKGNLSYVVSPRFALSCSRPMLEAAGALSKKYNLLLQTHISENTEEVDAVLKMHPWAHSYADVYAKTNCLHKGTLLGHGVHLTDDELKLIKKYDARIIHCATSNRFLGSGSLPLRKVQKNKISVALGSDVAGGYSLSMFNEMREASETSKSFGMKNAISPIEALYLATIGAAEAIGLKSTIGQLKKGFDADFIVVDDMYVNPIRGTKSKSKSEYSKPHEILSRLLYRTHPEMVQQSFVKGKCIFNRK